MRHLTKIIFGYPAAGNMGRAIAGGQVTGDHFAQTGFGSRLIMSGRLADQFSSMVIGITGCHGAASFLPQSTYPIVTIVTSVIVIHQVV